METQPPIARDLLVTLVLSLALTGCAASTGGGLPTDRRDGPPVAPPDATPMGECLNDGDCAEGLSCRMLEDGRYCVVADVVPERPPGDGTTCGECPAPGECREGTCVTPTTSGAFCEFDPECGDEMLCIGGHCTPDPRIPTGCSMGESCSGDLVCSATGSCICGSTADCPVGLVCSGGACVPDDPGGCIADAECPEGFLCDGGACVDDGSCGVVHPPLAGTWTMDTVLRLREALPGWLDAFLDAVAGPFHFIAGHTMTLDLGLPGFIEDIVADVVRSWADSSLPPWARELLGAIADMNDILSTWTIDETMVLTDTGVLDEYTGTHEWTEVEFTYRGMAVRGRPEDIIDWRFSPSSFHANATCGTLNIDRHDVDVSIGAIIAWAVNAVVYEATDGRYRTLDEALGAATAGFCDGAARAAEDAVDFFGVGTAVGAWCTSELGALTSELTRAVDDARLGLDLMSLKGHAPIVSDRLLDPGVWEGSLAGGDFTGDFTARK